MLNGSGDDTYRFAPGDGRDTIIERSGYKDILEIEEGFRLQEVWTTRENNNLVLRFVDHPGDVIIVENYFASGSNTIEEIHFADGTVWDRAQVISALDNGEPTPNRAPVYTGSIANQEATEGETFTWTLPTAFFTDPDGDALTYTLTLANGEPLPGWLTFNPATRTLSGTPEEDDVGNLILRVTATDTGNLSTSYYFGLKVDETDTIEGTNGADRLDGAAGDDHIRGLSGDDTLSGGNGNDTLEGGDGNDSLDGNAGDDALSGNAGNDTLVGGLGTDRLVDTAGNETYRFTRGDGRDFINDQDGDDVLEFGTGINYQQLWFLQAGNNLEINVIGTGDWVTVESWYLGDKNQIEQFQVGDWVLDADKVQTLVEAAQDYAPPPIGTTDLDGDEYADLIGVIDSVWYEV
ncbi:MAG: putative Ig domain-containing protein [Azoarcus sp.]|nr:putative Ig domain-containing protein [Azoarcus sp.]